MATVTLSEVYDTAFRFYDAAPWDLLRTSQVFALRLPGHPDPYYLSLNGYDGIIEGLVVYPHTEHGIFSMYQQLLMNQRASFLNRHSLSNDTDRCSIFFYPGDQLGTRNIVPIKAYLARKHIRFRPELCYPEIFSQRPYKMYDLPLEEDREILKEAMEAAIYLTTLPPDTFDEEMDETLSCFLKPGARVSMLTKSEGAGDGGNPYTISSVCLPPDVVSCSLPKPSLRNEALLEKLQKLPRAHSWAVRLFYTTNEVYQEHVQDRYNYYLLSLIAFDEDAEKPKLLGTYDAYDTDSDGEPMLEALAGFMIKSGFCPREFLVDRALTHSLLQSFSRQLSIRLVPVKSYPDLDDMEEGEKYIAEQASEEFDDAEDTDPYILLRQYCYKVRQSDAEDMRSMPEDIYHALAQLAEDGHLPEDVWRKMQRYPK
ncbi:MAG: hypothetical protein IJ083_15835 [Clostridia bacterium]|nr:hypothetical protein [Clostridia bacterium]